MEMKTIKRVALYAVFAVLVGCSVQLIVTDLQARGGGGHGGGGHGGGGHGGGHGGGGRGHGGHGHGGHGNHGGHGRGGYGRGGYGRGGYGGYGYGGGYWNSAGLWVPLAVTGGIIAGSAAANAGSYNDYDDYDDYYDSDYTDPLRARYVDEYDDSLPHFTY
jgi:hypothetical protein